MADELNTGGGEKTIEGSFEGLRDSIQAALDASGLFEHAYITNTFAGDVIVCAYGSGSTPTHWRVAYTLDESGGVALGTVTRVEIAEVVVAEAGDASDASGGENSDDEYEETSDDELDQKRSGELYRKTVPFEIKAVSETEVNGVKGWTYEGYASVFGVVDHEGDVTVPGCFAKSLAGGLPVTKYEHGPTIGICLEAKEDDHGLWVKGFVPEDPQTDLIRKLMKIGAVAKMSYGWRPYAGGMRKRADGARELLSIRVPEVSPVAIPMLDATEITAVKAVRADAPLGERLGAVADALTAATHEAEALVARRIADERDPSSKALDGVARLAVASGDALVACLRTEVKAGRAIAGVRKRHLADLMKSVRALMDSLPEGEREEIEAMLEGRGAGGKSAQASNADADARAARRREAEILELQLKRYARNARLEE